MIEAIRAQRLVEHDANLATRLVDAGELVDVPATTELVRQGSIDNDVYFILDGEVDISVNSRVIAVRRARESFGEMALVDGDAKRSASVIARTPLCVLRMSETAFHAIAKELPQVWRAVASVLAERLRQRDQFHHAPNAKPVLFLGSAVEGLLYAKHIQLGLKHAAILVRPWTSGVFEPGGVTIDSLLEQVERSDFAVFVFGPDDSGTSRDAAYFAPRDNVVFEAGMFMGALGRNRCLVVRDHTSKIKVPTDLLGVTQMTYVAGEDISVAIGPICTEIEAVVGKLGVK